MLKYKLLTVFAIISISIQAQSVPGGWEGGGNPDIGIGAVPAVPEPCQPGFNESGWETDCTDGPNIGPGTNVPIDDYIPFLLLAGVALGGIVIYRKQKQLS